VFFCFFFFPHFLHIENLAKLRKGEKLFEFTLAKKIQFFSHFFFGKIAEFRQGKKKKKHSFGCANMVALPVGQGEPAAPTLVP
jgi:hypothetical protein